MHEHFVTTVSCRLDHQIILSLRGIEIFRGLVMKEGGGRSPCYANIHIAQVKPLPPELFAHLPANFEIVNTLGAGFCLPTRPITKKSVRKIFLDTNPIHMFLFQSKLRIDFICKLAGPLEVHVQLFQV